MEELINSFGTLDMNNNRDNQDRDNQDRDNQNILTRFISEIENDTQCDIVLNLFCGYTGNMYLSDYSKEDGIVYILGSRNTKGRELYSITFNQKLNGHSLSCTCKDFQFRSKKLGIVCKHITFLVCKVGYILDHEYFKTKLLTDNQYSRLISILDNNAIWKNRHFSVKDVNKEFQINTTDFNSHDFCPICYDAFGDMNVNICCPQCKNYIHKKCMDIWLESHNNCVYCRSYSWKNYVLDVSKI
jgi:hypothetical protein